jgi:hypothetical protein
LEAKIWHNDEILGWYFIFLNPVFVLCSYFCGLSIFIIDFSILVMMSLLLDLITHDDSKMEGESFLIQVL